MTGEQLYGAYAEQFNLLGILTDEWLELEESHRGVWESLACMLEWKP